MAERGFALIQVLLVFAMLAVVVTKLQYEQRIQVERAYQSLTLSQTQVYLNSAEDFARVALKVERENATKQNDHFGELWNRPFPIEFEGTPILMKANDLQGRFNVNWLHPSAPNADNASLGFKRMLIHLNLDPAIADELKEWFDSNGNALFNYGGQVPSYRPSFEPMADVTEMRLLDSLNKEDYEILRPYISALPPGSALNINTASEAVFMSLASYISEQDAQGFVSNRPTDGYEATSDVTNTNVFQQNNGQMLINQLTVESDWFDLYIEVTVNDRTTLQSSTIHRTADTVLVTRRNRAITGPNTAPDDPTPATSSTPQPGQGGGGQATQGGGNSSLGSGNTSGSTGGKLE